MRSSDTKGFKCLKFSSKMVTFPGFVYVQLFYLNEKENKLFIANEVKLLNLHIGD